MAQQQPQSMPVPLPPGYEIKKKGHFWRNAGIGCGGLIVLAIIIGVAAAGGSHNATPASSSPAASSAPKTAQVLLDKTGSGINKTGTFAASGAWVIEYSFDCKNFGQKGNFQIYIYNADGSLKDIAANALADKGSDVAHENQGGTYYLQMNSECDWHVIVKG